MSALKLGVVWWSEMWDSVCVRSGVGVFSEC